MNDMNRVLRSILAGFALLTVAVPAWQPVSASEDIKNCYSVHGEARYGAFAYKHVVIVTNRCDVELQCEVWTDVDPTPRQPLTVGPKGTGEVIVRATSPARAFKAFGECAAK